MEERLEFDFNYPPDLPICEHRDEILSLLKRHQVVIVCGDTGSGKTTQLPKMAMELGRGANGRRIACTQPRRLAAVTVAERVAPHVAGMHLNDVRDFRDDHRQPGWGGVDFAALKPLAQRDVLRVFEPHQPVSFDELRTALQEIRNLWTTSPS